MLQLINPSIAQGTASASVPEVAASVLGVADAQAGAVFELQGVAELPPEILLELPATPEQGPALPAAVDAQRWLSSMLEQQAVQLEARETLEPTGLLAVPLAVAQGLPRGSLERTTEQALTAQLALGAGAATGLAVQPAASAEVPAQPALSAALLHPAQGLSPVLQEHAQGERLSQLGAPGAEPAALSALAEMPQNRTAAASQSLRLHESQARWGEQMLNSLRDTVEMQINQRIQSTTIRLDPPELGSMEIFLSHEAGRITVQLSAANADVARLLQQTSERLRQELVAQNFVQVNVQVSADAQGGRQHGHNPLQLAAEEPVLDARPQDDGANSAPQDSASDVLVTV